MPYPEETSTAEMANYTISFCRSYFPLFSTFKTSINYDEDTWVPQYEGAVALILTSKKPFRCLPTSPES